MTGRRCDLLSIYNAASSHGWTGYCTSGCSQRESFRRSSRQWGPFGAVGRAGGNGPSTMHAYAEGQQWTEKPLSALRAAGSPLW
jgi:hypothetical protein